MPKKSRRLADLDMSGKLDDDAYESELRHWQEEMRRIQQAYLKLEISAIIVFEGWDAAGKGGTIRRLTTLLDPRFYKVWPIGAPRPYYKERQYMARFWARMPPRSSIAIFDRSWYGRVLVERIEGFAAKSEWKRAYHEINNFERALVDDRTRIIKFYLHITPEEQLQRFRKRLLDPVKRWKLSLEDFRNRDRWEDYENAVDDMLEKTDTDAAPWVLVAANNKKYARIAILEAICRHLSDGIDLSPHPVDDAILDAARRRFDLDPAELERITNGQD